MQKIKTLFNSLTLIWGKVFLIICFSACSVSLLAQDEKVIFDLDKGSFNVKKIPYVHPITIVGLATKNGEEIDAIQLVVTKNTDDDQERLRADLYKQDQLTKAIDQYGTQLTTLSNAANKTSVEEITNVLTEGGFAELAKEIKDTKGITVEAAKTKVSDKSKEITDGLTEKKNSKITLDKEILDLQTAITKNQFYQGIWKKNGATKEFSFSLGKSLDMSASYTFSFTIYEVNKSTFPIDELINPVKDDLDKVLTDVGFISEKDLVKKIDTVFDKINNKVFANILAINADGTTSPKGLQLNDAKRAALNKAISALYAKTTDLKRLSDQLATNTIELEKLVNTLTLTGSRLDDLKRMIALEAQYNPTNFASAIPATTAADTKSAIATRYGALKEARDAIKPLEKEQKELLNSINSIFDFVKSLYVDKGNVTQAGQTNASGDTDLDGTRLSTIYGLGVVPLENDFGAIEWFQYVAVNIRLGDFDNRKPGKAAYEDPFWSRVAVTVGFATSSDMRYRGQHLDNPRIGFKPVIGLSFEPCKHLNLSAGIISFTPASIGNSQQDPKVRPYFSLSFDFNLFNYLIQKQ